MAACLQARPPGPRTSTGAQPLHLSPSQAAARDATSAAVGQHPLAAVGVSTARPAAAAAPAADFAGGDSDEAVSAVGNSFSRTAPCLLPEQDQVREGLGIWVPMDIEECSSTVSCLQHALDRGSAPASRFQTSSMLPTWPCTRHMQPSALHRLTCWTLTKGAVLQVTEVSVCGPRYWQHSVSSVAEAGNPLAACYSMGTLHVQRRAGLLSYADDPSGIRSLLSKAFRRVSLGAVGLPDCSSLCPWHCVGAGALSGPRLSESLACRCKRSAAQTRNLGFAPCC